jgi:endonuclease/exonuclease/phosphatase (EEP) superfamily protein YafD
MKRQRRSGPSLTDLIALCLGAVCLIAAVASQGGRESRSLDLLCSLALFWMLGAALAAIYGATICSGRTRLILVLEGALGVLAATALIAPELTRPISRPPAAAGETTVKIIAFNTWDRNSDEMTTAAWISAQKPDVVVTEESGPILRQTLVDRGYFYTRGNGHVSIFSRAAPGRAPLRIWIPEWRGLPPFARATFGEGAAEFSVIGVHLTRSLKNDSARRIQVLTEVLERYDRDRLILAGDFNLTPWSFALRRMDSTLGLERRDRALFSWPAKLDLGGHVTTAFPIFPLDHIYAGAAWRTISITRGPATGSDHFPVVAVLALSGQQTR